MSTDLEPPPPSEETRNPQPKRPWKRPEVIQASRVRDFQHQSHSGSDGAGTTISFS